MGSYRSISPLLKLTTIARQQAAVKTDLGTGDRSWAELGDDDGSSSPSSLTATKSPR